MTLADLGPQNLKSAEEMEEEEREAQSAKLQELIRRGSPEDLQEANRLMKVMAGYDTRSKVDYRAKAAEDVGKIQQKARLLEERLEEFKPGDVMKDGDVFEELASALSSAQPKIQKMCEEESDDHEAVAKLLDINDSIHRTVERYKLMKKGDIAGAHKIARGGPMPMAAGGRVGGAQELSLIDFDADSEPNGAAPQAGTQASGLENDLLGLSIGETSSYGQTGGISLGFGANTSGYLGPSRQRCMLMGHARYSRARASIVGHGEQYSGRRRGVQNGPSPPGILIVLLCLRVGPVKFPVGHAAAHISGLGVCAAAATAGGGSVRFPVVGDHPLPPRRCCGCSPSTRGGSGRRRRVVFFIGAAAGGPAAAARAPGHGGQRQCQSRVVRHAGAGHGECNEPPVCLFEQHGAGAFRVALPDRGHKGESDSARPIVHG